MKHLVHDKIVVIGDDYWIEDERGRHAFLVDGKALRLRDTLEIKEPDGRVLVTLRQKMLSLREAMTIEREGDWNSVVRFLVGARAGQNLGRVRWISGVGVSGARS
jgi:uncharacterized protein YxjI